MSLCVSFLNGGLYRRHWAWASQTAYRVPPLPSLSIIIYDAYINHAKDIKQQPTTTSLLCVCYYDHVFCFCLCLKKRIQMELGKLTRWLSGNDRWPFPSGRHLSERWRNCSASWRCWVASAIQTCWANRERKKEKESYKNCPDQDKYEREKCDIDPDLQSISHSSSVCRFGTFWKARVKIETENEIKSTPKRAEVLHTQCDEYKRRKSKKSEWKGVKG